MMPLVTHLPGSSALVFDFPNSGTAALPDFLHACEMTTLRSAEDPQVEKPYDFASVLGMRWMEAHFLRSHLGANRNATEIDVSLFRTHWAATP